MTKAQQARLAGKIRKAAEEQGIKQSEIAMKCGTSAGNVSYAMACKGTMSEEKWRLACEYVGVDFDAVMADSDTQPELIPCTGIPADAVEVPWDNADVHLEHAPPVPVCASFFDPEEFAIIAHLIEAHLIEDIIAKSGVRFEWLEKVMGIREKCRRAAP